jgi:hypothetical protein
MPNLPDPIMFAIPGFILLVIAEMIYGRMTGKTRFEPRDTAGSLIMGLGNTVSGVLLGGIVLSLVRLHRTVCDPGHWLGLVLVRHRVRAG